MIVPGSANALLLASLAGYQIPYSLRFRASNSAYLSRTSGASPTDQKKVTYSAWMKAAPSLSSSAQVALVSFGSGNAGMIAWNISSYSGRLFIRSDNVNDIQFTGAFRDPTAWGHIVVAIDTTQATAADRVKVWWNGTAMTYLSGTYPTQNSNSTLNAASTGCRLMSDQANGTYLDGYLAETHMIDGQALTPSSFGQTDATGVWVPKKYAGTYGSQGYYLKFDNATSTTTIGNDSSGNANNWTTSGISVTSGVTFDQMTDSPTTNFSTLNPLGSHTSVGTFSAANMQWTYAGGAYYPIVVGSAAINSKSYWEVTVTAVGGAAYIGIILASQQVKGTEGTNNTLASAGCWSYDNTGTKNNNNAPGSGSAYGLSYTTGDVIGVTYDPSTTTLTFYKNNSSQGSAYTNVTAGNVYAFVSGISGADFAVNFGQRPFTYTPPSGFKALNTENITSTAVSTSGSFTGNASTDGPFVWINGNPATLTINGNAVTFGTHADKTAGGFKLRSSSASYNASGSNSWTATAGKRFVQSKKPNNSQVNP